MLDRAQAKLGRKLFGEIKELGYKGCYSYLARHLSKWRHGGAPAPQARPLSRELSNMPIDPVTGRCISPLAASGTVHQAAAAAHCNTDEEG
jgi:hypothetical protein